MCYLIKLLHDCSLIILFLVEVSTHVSLLNRINRNKRLKMEYNICWKNNLLEEFQTGGRWSEDFNAVLQRN